MYKRQTPPKVRLENKVRQSLRQATHDLRPGRASKDERRRVALAVVALHVFLARKLGAYTPIVVVVGAASAVFALRHHDDDAALRNARSYARRFLSYALAAVLTALRNSRTYYAQLERVVPPRCCGASPAPGPGGSRSSCGCLLYTSPSPRD